MPTYLLHCHHWEPGSWSAGGFSLRVKFVQWSKECLFARLSDRTQHWKRGAESLVKKYCIYSAMRKNCIQNSGKILHESFCAV